MTNVETFNLSMQKVIEKFSDPTVIENPYPEERLEYSLFESFRNYKLASEEPAQTEENAIKILASLKYANNYIEEALKRAEILYEGLSEKTQIINYWLNLCAEKFDSKKGASWSKKYNLLLSKKLVDKNNFEGIENFQRIFKTIKKPRKATIGQEEGSLSDIEQPEIKTSQQEETTKSYEEHKKDINDSIIKKSSEYEELSAKIKTEQGVFFCFTKT